MFLTSNIDINYLIQYLSQELDFRDEYWATLEVMVNIMEPYADATQQLTSESLSKDSAVYPITNVLYMYCKWLAGVNPEGGGLARALKEHLQLELTSRYQLNVEGRPTDLCQPRMKASLMDPRYACHISFLIFLLVYLIFHLEIYIEIAMLSGD